MKISRYKLTEATPGKETEGTEEWLFSNIRNKKADPIKVRDALVDYLNKNGKTDAADLLKTFTPRFVKYYAECAGAPAIRDTNNIFLSYLNNPGAKAIFGNEESRVKDSEAEDRFTDIYNIVISKDSVVSKSYVDDKDPQNNLLIYPNLFDNVKAFNNKVKLLRWDIGAKKPKTKSAIRRSIDNNTYSDIINQYDAKYGTKSTSSSSSNPNIKSYLDRAKTDKTTRQEFTKTLSRVSGKPSEEVSSQLNKIFGAIK